MNHKYYGQFNPPVDRVLCETFFRDQKEKGVCIECGAFDGVVESCCKFFEETLGWSCINIECVPCLFQRLVINRPLSRNICVALSDSESVATPFTHMIHPSLGNQFGNGSIKHCESHIKSLLDSGCQTQEITVPTTTFAKLVQDLKLERIDLFVIDVEGHEMSVIKGMKDAHVLPRVICIEYMHLGLECITKELEPLGYKFHSVAHNNAHFMKIV